jgi:hypothetical protein
MRLLPALTKALRQLGLAKMLGFLPKFCKMKVYKEV